MLGTLKIVSVIPSGEPAAKKYWNNLCRSIFLATTPGLNLSCGRFGRKCNRCTGWILNNQVQITPAKESRGSLINRRNLSPRWPQLHSNKGTIYPFSPMIFSLLSLTFHNFNNSTFDRELIEHSGFRKVRSDFRRQLFHRILKFFFFFSALHHGSETKVCVRLLNISVSPWGNEGKRDFAGLRDESFSRKKTGYSILQVVSKLSSYRTIKPFPLPSLTGSTRSPLWPTGQSFIKSRLWTPLSGRDSFPTPPPLFQPNQTQFRSLGGRFPSNWWQTSARFPRCIRGMVKGHPWCFSFKWTLNRKISITRSY